MMNELHVSLITQLKGAREGEKEAVRGMNVWETLLLLLVASLCLRRRAAADLRTPDVKRTRQKKTCNQSDKVK